MRNTKAFFFFVTEHAVVYPVTLIALHNWEPQIYNEGISLYFHIFQIQSWLLYAHTCKKKNILVWKTIIPVDIALLVGMSLVG